MDVWRPILVGRKDVPRKNYTGTFGKKQGVNRALQKIFRQISGRRGLQYAKEKL
jgi:hypothetical protein